MTDIKPCPFCKCNQAMTWHIGHYDKPWIVECCRCQAQGPHADTEEIAIELWNRRAKEDAEPSILYRCEDCANKDTDNCDHCQGCPEESPMRPSKWKPKFKIAKPPVGSKWLQDCDEGGMRE